MLAFLPPDSAKGRVNELRASARTHVELEALAIEKYERDVVGFRVYTQVPLHDLSVLQTDPPAPRRSLA